MWSWLRKPRKQQPAIETLRGTPARPRTKTYSAETGFVYQYTYRGYRSLAEPAPVREHVFAVSRDRIHTGDLRIQLRTSAIRTCEMQIGRNLLDAEQYAIAKLTLFNTFDNITGLVPSWPLVIPSADEMELHLRHLGRL